jgi:hypothetical protein
VGPLARKKHPLSPEDASRRLSSHLIPYVAGAPDGFLRCHHLVILYLDAKLPLVGGGGGDVMGLCRRQRRRTNNSWKARGQIFLAGVIPSHRTIWAGVAYKCLP